MKINWLYHKTIKNDKNLLMKYYKILYLVMLAIFLVPLCEQQLEVFSIKPLDGYYFKSLKPEFTSKDFINSNFQDASEQYMNEHFGFRNTLLRCRNQIFFSIFHQSPNTDNTLGSDGYLYENKYINEYYGNNLVGDSIIDFLTQDIRALQDTLANHHIVLLTVIAPSKPYFFSQYIPSSMNLTPENQETNYAYLKKYAEERELNLINFNDYFLKQPEALKNNPLYSINGIHWTHYAATMAFDSILKRLGQLSGKAFPEMVVTSTEKITASGGTDDDIANTMNLLRVPVNNEDLIHPHVQFEFKGARPKVLGVADSYYGTLESLHLLADAFDSPDYWFGYELKFPRSKYDVIEKKPDFLRNEILSRDAIILMCTPPNAHRLSWGFVQDALALFRPADVACKYNFAQQKDFEDRKYSISHSTEWLQGLLNSAKKNHENPDAFFDKYVIGLQEEQTKK